MRYLLHEQTRRALGGVHLPPTKVFRRLTGSVNKTMLKALLAAAANRYVYVGFSRRKIPRSRAEMISEKAIRFRHPDIVRIGFKS